MFGDTTHFWAQKQVARLNLAAFGADDLAFFSAASGRLSTDAPMSLFTAAAKHLDAPRTLVVTTKRSTLLAARTAGFATRG